MVSTATEWVSLILRWLHVISGIAWIGASFYFIALDLSLKPNERLDPRVKGDTWQVHGGGFYQMQKFLVAPDHMPEQLTWFKWEAYCTWLFGFALMVVTYYAEPALYLVDPAKLALAPWMATAIGVVSLGAGWIIYDMLCKSPIGRSTARLALTGFVILVAITWFYTRVFSGRGAFIHVGALIGTIMVANVFLVIIPNQRKTVAALVAGQEPNPLFGAVGKQRSVHNNYLTLPVIFTMISNHYPIVFESRWSWLVLTGVFVGSFLIRHWFNVHHTGAHADWRLWPAGAIPIAAVAVLTMLTQPKPPSFEGIGEVAFTDVQIIIGQRCLACHSAHPTFEGISEAPKGIMFDTPQQVVRNAPLINQQAVVARAMPLGNATQITDEERMRLGAWIAQGAHTE